MSSAYTGGGAADILVAAALVLAAFWLGACPCSLWLGRWLLGRDIRDYGDGNPGVYNVFRAGGRLTGGLASFLDVAKGIPFVILAQSFFGLPQVAVLVVALGAVLGSAFSPLLRWRGSKSIAVTFGVLLVISPSVLLVVFAAFLLLGFLFLESDAWTAVLGPAGSLVYLMSTHAGPEATLFMLCLLAVFTVKQFPELRSVPRPGLRVVHWLQSRRGG